MSPRTTVRFIATAATLSLALLAPVAAEAVYQCDGQTDDCQCSANNPYPCCDNGGGNYGNCTWWAWESACCNWAYGLPGWGNANTWDDYAQANPDFNVQSTPVVGSIACRNSGTWGHVAWVTGVSGSTVTVTEMNCCSGCNNGVRTWTYQASYFDGGYIVRANQCQCNQGDTQTDPCGNCGTRTRSCGADCMWGSWSSCTGEGPCAPGATDTQACGDCGQHSRSCSSSCQWESWGACSGPDPGGACDTGLLGVCAAGTQLCVDGYLQCEQTVAASGEACDGLDNDCDGSTDEDQICGTGGSPPVPDAGTGLSGGTATTSSSGTGTGTGGWGAAGGTGVPAVPTPDGAVSGYCSCRLIGAPPSSGGAGSVWWLILGGLGLLGYQRRRR